MRPLPLAAAAAAALLLVPLSAALVPALGSAAAGPTYRLVLHPGQGAEVLLLPPGRGPGAAEGTEASECQLFAPAETWCEGDVVHWTWSGQPWVLDVSPGLETASNTWVHAVQEVDGKPAFAASWRTNLTHWAVPYLTRLTMELRTWGVPQTDVDTNVRVDVSHLPAAGHATFGGFHGYLGPP
jgi:hypothetical protein